MDLIDEVNKLGEYITVERGLGIVEGSCTPAQLEYLVEKARHAKVVHETGFNFGMSSLAFLMANPDLIVVSYDDMRWPCARAGKNYIDELFPGRHIMVEGDSKVTLFKPTMGCDLFLVDGGHDFDTAYHDITQAASRASVVIVDDTNDPEVRRAYQKAVDVGLIQHVANHTDLTFTLREWREARGQNG